MSAESVVVVLATAAVPRPELENVLRDEDDLVFVVPAVEQSRLQWLANDEDGARAAAEAVAEETTSRLDREPTLVQVKEGPVEVLVEDAVREHRPRLVVVAIRDSDDATWMETKALERLPARVAHVAVKQVRLSAGRQGAGG